MQVGYSHAACLWYILSMILSWYMFSLFEGSLGRGQWALLLTCSLEGDHKEQWWISLEGAVNLDTAAAQLRVH